jgi:hypothetical protein
MIAQQPQSSRATGFLTSTILTRNLSSADEGGPAPKKARNAASTPHKVSLNDTGKQNTRGIPQKARLALTSTNLFSSAVPQPLPKPARGESSAAASARRSTRLLNGNGGVKEPSKLQKVA